MNAAIILLKFISGWLISEYNLLCDCILFSSKFAESFNFSQNLFFLNQFSCCEAWVEDYRLWCNLSHVFPITVLQHSRWKCKTNELLMQAKCDLIEAQCCRILHNFDLQCFGLFVVQEWRTPLKVCRECLCVCWTSESLLGHKKYNANFICSEFTWNCVFHDLIASPQVLTHWKIN